MEPPVEARARAESAERVQVRVEAAAADHVPARRGHLGAAEAGQQRPRDEERGADPVRDLGVDLRLAHVRRAEGDDVLVAPVDAHAEPAQELEHRLHVADARDVAEDDLLLGQEACRKRRQRRVLVTRRHDRARQRLTPLDDELLHEPCRDTVGLQRLGKRIEGHRLCIRARRPVPCRVGAPGAGGTAGLRRYGSPR